LNKGRAAPSSVIAKRAGDGTIVAELGIQKCGGSDL
jgi:hypothetical protein